MESSYMKYNQGRKLPEKTNGQKWKDLAIYNFLERERSFPIV